MELAYEYANSFKQLHPGFDCFVTRIDLLPEIISYLEDIVIGYPPVGNILSLAARHADPSCLIIRGMHGTFHVGSRNGNWSDWQTKSLLQRNGEIAERILRKHSDKRRCKTIHLKLSAANMHGCYP